MNAPLGDTNFRWRSVDRCIAAATPIYSLAGAEGKLVVEHPDYGHDFQIEQRKAAYKTLDTVLQPSDIHEMER